MTPSAVILVSILAPLLLIAIDMSHLRSTLGRNLQAIGIGASVLLGLALFVLGAWLALVALIWLVKSIWFAV